MSGDFDQNVDSLTPLLSDLFEIGAVYRQNRNLVFSLTCRGDRARSKSLLTERLKAAGYTFTTADADDALILNVDPRARLKIPPVNLVLFFVTLLSVYVVAVFWRYYLVRPGNVPGDMKTVFSETVDALSRGAGLEFTVALMSILLVHEMGHFWASRRRRIITSWPYFLPAPNVIGSFGAVITSKSPFWNRRHLIEVGAIGPVAGWIVAVGWLVWGLSNSAAVPFSALAAGDIPFSLAGESILMRLIGQTFMGALPDGFYYRLTEAAFAGWVGLLVTAINMLPIGQLDGGHIVYGLAQRRQRLLGWAAMLGLFVLGFQSTMWWLFAVFGLFFGVAHPPTLRDAEEPGAGARILGLIALAILVISFTPVPFR